jgi:hypothetical protein
MKKNIFAFCLILVCFSGYAFATINEKVLATFKSTFPTAQEVAWQEFPDHYVVNFMEEGVRNRINYDRDGNFIGATRYYSAEHLPVNILTRVAKKYPNRTIFGVTEVETDSNTDYYIKLEDSENWTTVKSDDSGNMQIIETYKKAAQ